MPVTVREHDAGRPDHTRTPFAPSIANAGLFDDEETSYRPYEEDSEDTVSAGPSHRRAYRDDQNSPRKKQKPPLNSQTDLLALTPRRTERFDWSANRNANHLAANGAAEASIVPAPEAGERLTQDDAHDTPDGPAIEEPSAAPRLGFGAFSPSPGEYIMEGHGFEVVLEDWFSTLDQAIAADGQALEEGSVDAHL